MAMAMAMAMILPAGRPTIEYTQPCCVGGSGASIALSFVLRLQPARQPRFGSCTPSRLLNACQHGLPALQ